MKRNLTVALLIAMILITPGRVTASSIGAPSYVNAFVYSVNSIRVTWDNQVHGASGFTIQRKTNSGNYVTIANVSSASSSYTDMNIANGNTYTYRVYATSGGLSGDHVESFPVGFLYPTSLVIEGLSDSQLQIQWTYPSAGNIPESNFQTIIERRSDGSSSWQTVGTVPGAQRTYTDTGLTEASRYYYRVRALTATSALYLYFPNNSVGQVGSTLLKAPTEVKAEILSTSAIRLSWTDNSEKETGYRVERKTRHGSFVSIATLAANVTTYTDLTATNGEQYTYRIIASSSTFRGTPSDEVTVPFLFPISFSVKEAYSTQITLTWGYPGSGFIQPDNSEVLIERREAGASQWMHIHTTRPGETEYTDSGLTPGTRYFYRIRSRHDRFVSDYFPSTAGISEYTRLALDTTFYGYALSNQEIRLEWDKDKVSGYTIVLEKLSSNGVFEVLRTLTNTGSYIDTVAPGSTQVYRMKVRSTLYDSNYTPEVEIMAETLPTASAFTIKSVTPERVFITWEYEKPLETGFEVWRKAASNEVWMHIATTTQNQHMYSDEQIQNGETYTYKTRAVKNRTIFSPFSEPASVNVSFTSPDGLLTISMAQDGMLYLGWNDFSDIEDYYVVEYKTNINDRWNTLEKIPRNMTLYRFRPQPGIDYTLRVRAFSSHPVYERFSNECFYSTKLPAIPSLSPPAIIGSNRIVLRWVDLADNAQGFVVYRRNNDYENDFKAIGTVGENKITFADSTVLPDQNYTYLVRAKNAAGESFDSNRITVQTPRKTQFLDLSRHLWAKDAIDTLSSMGIIEGDGRGNYNPSGNITRAEFIKLLVAAFSFPESPIGSFNDVTPDKWHHRWIMTAHRHGILEADEKGLFYPDTPITRQDIVFYASRAITAGGYPLDQPPLYVLYSFEDYHQISAYAQSAFAALNHAGIVTGIGNNRLGPLNTATRAEAATIIHRVIKVFQK